MMNRSPKLFTLLLATGLAAFAQQYTISTVAGIGGVLGYDGDGAAAISAQLVRPFRVAVDSKGNIYIADYYSYRVRMVTASNGTINTIAGNGVPGYSGDNEAGASASIGDIHGIAVDSSGNVFIAEPPTAAFAKSTPRARSPPSQATELAVTRAMEPQPRAPSCGSLPDSRSIVRATFTSRTTETLQFERLIPKGPLPPSPEPAATVSAAMVGRPPKQPWPIRTRSRSTAAAIY